MLRRTALALVLAVLVALPVTAWAGMKEGDAAYKRGDYATALREFRPLAEQGVAAAQFYLGINYDKGQGVPQDSVLAHMWFNLAASRFAPGSDRDMAIQLRESVAAKMTPAQIAEAQRLAREWKPKKASFIVYFDFDSAKITAKGRAAIGQALSWSSAMGPGEIFVTGHTDRAGANSYNMKLSERRAEAVADALIDGGLYVGVLIKTGASGEGAPAVATADGKLEARNRRVEVNFFHYGGISGGTAKVIRALPPEKPIPVGEEVFVPVHYATDRTVTGKAEPNHYYGSDRGELRYGRALVSIPKYHDIGRMERPKIWRFEISEDPKKHVVLRALEEMDEDQFFAGLATEVARLQAKATFVFLPGFNVTFAEATRRTAQMAFDLFLVGYERGEATLSTVAVLYSWPSNGKTLLYTHDANNSEASAAHLKAFLKDVAARSGAESITIVAHSMGNRPLTAALNEIGLEMRAGDGPLVKEIVLAAPDIDRTVFLNVAEAVRRTGERITLYASRHDKALKLSMALNGFPRLGDATNGVVIFDGGDSIDASAVGDDILAHSYYVGVSILTDLYSLIIHGNPPDKRFGLLAQGAPPNRFWTIRSRAFR